MRYQFVDCRWELGSPAKGRELYLEGHVPGASFLDVDEDLSDQSVEGQGRHPLPSAERFAAAAGRAGIGEGVFAVAYGTMGGAERLWWLLRHFGHDDCAVLVPGIDAWLGPLVAGEEQIARSSRRTSEPATRSMSRRSPAGSTIPASSWSTRGCRRDGGARRTRSTRCPAGFRAH
jgi:thiosulfate/3-mercaptopyruvate sulfurtransferase